MPDTLKLVKNTLLSALISISLTNYIERSKHTFPASLVAALFCTDFQMLDLKYNLNKTVSVLTSANRALIRFNSFSQHCYMTLEQNGEDLSTRV